MITIGAFVQTNARKLLKESARMHWRQKSYLLASLFTVLVPFGAHARQAALPSPTASYFMHIAFPDWNGAVRPGRQASPVIRHLKLPSRGAPSPVSEPAKLFEVAIAPMFATQLDESHAVLVTLGYVKALSRTSSGPPFGVVGVDFLTLEKGDWRLSKSIPTVTLVAGYRPYNVKLEKWQRHGRVLSFVMNWNYQGASRDDLYLLELSFNRAFLLVRTAIEGDTDGEGVNASDPGLTCEQILDPRFVSPKNPSYLDQFECTKFSGSWALKEDAVEFRFSGAARNINSAGELLPIRVWHSKVVLVLQKGQSLKLVSGKLPTFDF